MMDLTAALRDYLVPRFPQYQNLEIVDVVRIPGGASCETSRFKVRFVEEDEVREKRWIIRRSPAAGLIDTERRTEFVAYQGFYGSSVPVPQPILLEEDEGHLGTSFMIVEEVTGCSADAHLFDTPHYIPLRQQIGFQKWHALGRIAAKEASDIWPEETLAKIKPSDCWRTALAYWEAQIRNNQIQTEPLVWAAIRWLYRNPPPAPAKISVVHGDYRSGNFLFNDQGDVTSILDWEMSHPGDPLEDIAWAMTPLWASAATGLPGRLIPRREALAIWEQGSGLRVNQITLHWWDLFSCVKGIGIWTTAANKVERGESFDYMLLGSAWWAMDIHLKELTRLFAEKLAKGEL